LSITAVRRWWPLAAVLGLLVTAALAASRSRPHIDRFDHSSRAARPQPTPAQPSFRDRVTAGPAEAAHVAAGGGSGWIGTVAVVLLALVVLVIGAFVLRAIVRGGPRRRRARPVRFSPAVTAIPSDVVAALEAGIEELNDSDDDPRRAVIACWVRLERAAVSAGVTRTAADSPTDLVGRLLSTQRVDAGALAGLAAAYREARYATRTVDERMRRQAIESLQRLRADLGSAVEHE
jgi:hypothetical protein